MCFNATWIYAPEEDLARWCLLGTSWLCARGWRWVEVSGRGPSRLRVRCRVCSANSVWISARSRPDTHRPFSPKTSSPGRRPGNTDEYEFFRKEGAKSHTDQTCDAIIGGFRIICAILKQAGTFVECQLIRKHFADKYPAVFLAVNVSCYCETW